MSNTAIGFGIIVAVVLIGVGAYTVYKLRKQVQKTKRKEEDKKTP